MTPEDARTTTGPVEPGPDWGPLVDPLPDERLRVALFANPESSIRMPARRHRPRPFGDAPAQDATAEGKPWIGRKTPRDPLRRFLGFLWDPFIFFLGRPAAALLDRTVVRGVLNPLRRLTHRLRDGSPLASGGSASAAHGLLCALNPRPDGRRLHRRLELTDQRLRVSYRTHVHAENESTPYTELGWSMPLADLGRVRRRKSPAGDPRTASHFEFGFTDGSWATLTVRREADNPQLAEFLRLLEHLRVPTDDRPTRT
ncbi:hypothetical protein MTQ01_02120 [Streptomyces sp. XM4193]|uniref:hypothetical protein n=1 Tax=Streptomyces sp. XM4193 TaxID=2929782 RepID=UPI001FFA7C73|nr:hypothetical protein [Streptomyces sp. XM4193]MCK1794837.1 hypothetical protein [Streptomyces sp. XM4193]